jgi:transposase
VAQIAEQIQKSRPTIYGWADRAIAATIDSLRNIRTGRPPKDHDWLDESEELVAPEKPESSPSFLAETTAQKTEDQRLDDAPG